MSVEGRKETSEALLRALSGQDANAQLPLVARTRRAIRIADQERRDQGVSRRRSIGIALFVLGGLIVLIAPALWDSVEEFAAGEHLCDLPMQLTLLSTCLFLSVVAALVLLWRSRVDQDGSRRER